MIDILDVKNGDIVYVNSQAPRAKNLFDVQIGTLTYLQDWGIDINYFLNPDYKIQTEAFKNYLIQRLAYWNLTLILFTENFADFIDNWTFTLAKGNNTNLIQ